MCIIGVALSTAGILATGYVISQEGFDGYKNRLKEAKWFSSK